MIHKRKLRKGIENNTESQIHSSKDISDFKTFLLAYTKSILY